MRSLILASLFSLFVTPSALLHPCSSHCSGSAFGSTENGCCPEGPAPVSEVSSHVEGLRTSSLSQIPVMLERGTSSKRGVSNTYT
ncbi:hypothetical protein B0H13DRAFT_2025987 [Mycena leptocephala]|nr:hypothetical protein B0H13DRAFT_2025987 [Mycena leptocephala]